MITDNLNAYPDNVTALKTRPPDNAARGDCNVDTRRSCLTEVKKILPHPYAASIVKFIEQKITVYQK